jgi:two-component system response regulator YesN
MRAKAIMADHLAEELSLESVAAELRITPTHLSRLFVLESGAGFGDCLARARIDRAKGLLASGHSVKESSALVGYRDPAYFARVFRRLEGLSPGEYRWRA